MKEKLEQLEKAFQEKKVRQEVLKEQFAETEKRMKEIHERETLLREALSFLEKVSVSQRKTLALGVEQLLTESLRLIYGPQYSAVFVYGVKNNRSFVDVKIRKGDHERSLDGFGGGVGDTVASVLRLALLIAKRDMSRFLVLDESWKHLDGDRVEAVAEFLKSLTDKLGLQLLFVTHHKAFLEYADKVIRLQYEDKKTKII